MKKDFKSIYGTDYSTPQWLFDKLNNEFHFECDLACNKENVKCESGLFVEECDSLAVDWHKLSSGWLWLNPPYSPLKAWITKCQDEFLKGAKIVALIPPIISTTYFQRVKPAQIRIITGRINFYRNKKQQSGNTRDSCLVIYGNPIKTDVIWINREDFKNN